jgi:predicted RNA-binding Zn-ribbon protein involved in translation (DUF1610 family)
MLLATVTIVLLANAGIQAILQWSAATARSTRKMMPMNDKLMQFACTNCGGSKFKPAGEGTKLEDFFNAPCADCGTILTEDEIKTQAQKMTAEVFRRKFGDGGMKIEI